MLEEEGDATEIFFVLKGNWAIAFDCFTKLDEDNLDEIEPHMRGRRDMRERGILIGQKKKNCGYFGAYYVMANKRSAYFYVALGKLETFVVSKAFMFNQIFKKFHGLHGFMLAESFARYVRDIRKPVNLLRTSTIKRLN